MEDRGNVEVVNQENHSCVERKQVCTIYEYMTCLVPLFFAYVLLFVGNLRFLNTMIVFCQCSIQCTHSSVQLLGDTLLGFGLLDFELSCFRL